MPPIIKGTSATRVVPITANLPATLSAYSRRADAISSTGVLLSDGADQGAAGASDATFFNMLSDGQNLWVPIEGATGAIIWPFALPNSGDTDSVIGVRLWNRLKYAIVHEGAGKTVAAAQQVTNANLLDWTCFPLFVGTFNCDTSPVQNGNAVVAAGEKYATDIVTVLNRGYPNQVQFLGNQSAGVIVPDSGRVGIKLDCIGHAYLEILIGPDSDSANPSASASAIVQMLTGG